MLQEFFISQIPANVEQASYNMGLVALSYAVAVLASHVALALSRELVTEARPSLRRWLLWAGAFVLGTGIWSMHFIGMLAYQMDMKMEYDAGLTVLSLVVAVAVAYFVFGIISRSDLSWRRIAASACLLGLGISSMHYIGMAAMKMDASMRYLPDIFFLSVLIAISASAAALWIVFHLARHSGRGHAWYNAGAALLMGAAICGMHYTGMKAVVFIPHADCRYEVNQHFETLTLIVTTGISLILGIAFALLLYRRLNKSDAAKQNNFPLRLLVACCFLTLATGLGIIITATYNDFRLQEIVTVDDMIVDAADVLMYADDAMSFTLKMAVNTGKPEWEKKYNDAYDSIRKSLLSIEDYFTEEMEQDRLKAVSSASRELHEIESHAFDLVRRKDMVGVRQLLTSKSYVAAQKDYADRLQELTTLLKQSVATKLHSISNILHYIPYVILLLSSLLFVAWYFAVRSVRRWHDELESARNRLAVSEKEAQEKQHFLDQVINNIPLAIFAKNVKEGYRWEVWNHKAESLFELNAEDVLNKTDYDAFPKHEADFFRQTDISVMTSRQVVDIPAESVTTKRGTWTAHTIKVPIYDDEGEPSILLGILEDITEAQAKDQALRVAHELLTDEKTRLQTIMDSMMEGIITIDSEGIIQSLNIGAEKMFGYSADDLVGKNVSILMPEPDKSRHDGYLGNYSKTRESRIIGRGRELKGRNKSGGEFPMTLSVKNMLIDGKTYFIGLARDITEQKRKEQELGVAKEQAEQANASKSDFLANMSHEIRTPMNGVLGMAGLLLDTELSPEQRGWAELIKRSGESLMEIINDILDFSKIEAGRLVLEPIAFELEKAVMEVTDLLSLRTQEKGIELLVEMVPGLPASIIADPLRFRQILLNLTGNAIKFTEKGHVLIRIRRGAHEQGSLCLHVDVEDTGIGIPSDKLLHIFDKFSQAEESTTRRFGGTGLGLTISKKLIEKMGGSVEVTSQLGSGSRFTFRILVEEAPPVSAYSQIPACDLSGLSALIIDDSRINCDILSGYLDSWNVKCETVVTSAQTRSMLQNAARQGKPYDFIFIDYHIGDLNGMELAEWIQLTGICQESMLFMITSLGQVVGGSDLVRKGFSAFFAKPYYPDQLKAAMQLLQDARMHHTKLPLVTRFTISQMQHNEKKTHHVAGDYSGTRVLVVEDMKVNLMLVTKLLEKHGCQVFSAGHGGVAVEMVKHDHFELVFMDCQMPVMDGFEATRRIREFEGNQRHTIIVALTADAMVGDREKCLNAGMDDYLNKPLRADKVTEMLHKWVKASSAEESKAR